MRGPHHDTFNDSLPAHQRLFSAFEHGHEMDMGGKQKKGDGINGGMMPRKNPGQPFMNYISVDSIDAACKKVEKAGGVIVMPKTEIGAGMGWIAAFQDTEGNIMGFHEAPKKPLAKK